MVRRKDKLRKIGNVKKEDMAEAMRLVLDEGMSIRQAAKRMGMAFQTLHRYVLKKKANPHIEIRFEPHYDVRKIFSNDQEHDLAEYLDHCSKMAYGLSTTALRKLAYEMAEKNKIQVPFSWLKNKCAGLEWMRGFMHRNKHLSIRKPESCSLSRLTSFNRKNVQQFFDNLECVLKRNPQFADGSRVFNLDETGLTTVQKPKKVIAKKGVKQLNQCTSAERGQLVTVVAIISAAGTFLPPVMIFPRKHLKTHMLNGAPTGTLGLTSLTGWMTTELFPSVMQHFIKYSNSTKDNPSLLIYDNHESHMGIQVLDLAKDNGVSIVTLPPHCSHKIQPLDLTVFGPLKAYYNEAVDSWMRRNPGITMTIYQIAECLSNAHLKAMTPSNIVSGFRKSGIFPLNKHVFVDADYFGAEVTDRPLNTPELQPSTSKENENKLPTESNGDPFANHAVNKTISTNEGKQADQYISPKAFRGYPKAQPRKKKIVNRRRGRSTILTDTPEKEAIATKTQRKLEEALLKAKKKTAKDLFKRSKAIESSDDEDESQMIFEDSSDGPESFSNFDFDELERKPIVDDYVLVRFPNSVFYVAKILAVNDNEFDVSFLRKREKLNGFTMPDVPDLASVLESDIVMLLPAPLAMKTKRLSRYLCFAVSFSNLDVR